MVVGSVPGRSGMARVVLDHDGEQNDEDRLRDQQEAGQESTRVTVWWGFAYGYVTAKLKAPICAFRS